MKFKRWNIGAAPERDVAALRAAGYPYLLSLVLASRGFIEGRTAAILTDGGANVSLYVNPIPAGLVLTGIVVSVSVSAFSLALIQRIYGSYGTVDMNELLEIMKKKGE